MTQKLRVSEQFRIAFEQLKTACDASPKKLVTFFGDVPEFGRLASKVDSIASQIERVQRYRKTHPQISNEFIQDWKDYLYKWRKEIDYVVSAELLASLDFEVGTFEDFQKDRGFNFRPLSAPDPDFEDEFRPESHDGGAAFSGFMLEARDAAGYFRDKDEDLFDAKANALDIGRQALEYFENTIGIDINRAFERWNRIPAIFVPSHVSDRHGLAEKGSLYDLFDEAVRAYIVGAPAAAVAMCRALLEMVLRDHYLRGPDGQGGDLHGVINLAAARYDFINASKLHQLRMNANDLLHNYSAQSVRLLDDEKTVLSFFRDLKFYIEKAPVT